MRTSQIELDLATTQPTCYMVIPNTSLEILENLFKKSTEEAFPSFNDLIIKLAALPGNEWHEFINRVSIETLHGLIGEGDKLSNLMQSPSTYVENNQCFNKAAVFIFTNYYFHSRLFSNVLVDAAHTPIMIEADHIVVKSLKYSFIKFYGTADQLKKLANESGEMSVVFKRAISIEGKDFTIARDGTLIHHPVTPNDFSEDVFENYLESIKPPESIGERFYKVLREQQARKEQLRREARAQRVFEEFLRVDRSILDPLDDPLMNQADIMTTPKVSQLGFLTQAQPIFPEIFSPDSDDAPKDRPKK